jgi:hypothetical protein
MPWVPVNHPPSAQGYSLVWKYNMLRAHQYTMSASSPRSSVPAATVKPSRDTSQERSALCFPSNGTAGRHRSFFFKLPERPGFAAVRKFHLLSIAVAPVRSSHTRTAPSLPEERIALLFMPARESTPRKDVVPSRCPSNECNVRSEVLSNKNIL